MRRCLAALLLLACFHAPARAQSSITGPTVVYGFAGVPSGSCSTLTLAVNTTNGNLYTCLNGAWTIVSGGGGSSALSAITAATQSNTIANGNFPQAWNWAQVSDAQTAMAFGETSAATGGTLTNGLANQAEFAVSTLSNSTAVPFSVTQGSITNTVATPLAQFQGTWNNGSLVGVALDLNITNTSSAAGSLLYNFQVNNASVAKLDKSANMTLSGASAGYISFGQGAENCAANQQATSACFEAPAAVASYKATVPGAAPVNNNSAMLFSNANPAVGSFSKMPQIGMVTAQQATLTTVVNMPGLSFPVDANSLYTMSCTLYYQVSATTANLSIAITGPSTPTFVTYSLFDPDTATQIGAALVATSFATTLNGSGTSTATTNFPATITMGLSNGANSGTVQVQAGANGAGNSTVQTGSFCVLQ